MGEPVDCAPSTARAVPISHRKTLEFYDQCIIKLNGGVGDQRELSRTRDITDDDGIVIVKGDDGDTGVGGAVRLRVDDISVEEDGQVWLHGYRMYTRTQLDASVSCLLGASFDEKGGELVESVNQIAFPVESVIRFGRVLSTKHHNTLTCAKSLPVDGCCHSGGSFVDEDLGGKWKLVKSTRNGATAVEGELPRMRARTVVR